MRQAEAELEVTRVDVEKAVREAEATVKCAKVTLEGARGRPGAPFPLQGPVNQNGEVGGRLQDLRHLRS